MATETELKTRVVDLALDENNVTTLTGNKLVITLRGTLPLISMSDTLVTRKTVKESIYDNTVSRLASLNTIADPTYYEALDVDGNPIYIARFIFLTSFVSSVTNNYMRAYYDKKYKDILLIPELEYIDQNMTGITYSAWGYRVGGGKKINEAASDTILPVTDTFDLPTVNQDINNKHIVITMHGIASNGDNSTWMAISGSDFSSNDQKNQLGGLLSLGTPADVFVTPAPVPVYTITQVTNDRYMLKHIGITNPSNIYIPIMF